MEKTTQDLYEDSVFAEWLKTKPQNVDCNYDSYKVDSYGTRVEITFWIEEE